MEYIKVLFGVAVAKVFCDVRVLQIRASNKLNAN
jgi:hypothetical protein